LLDSLKIGKENAVKTQDLMNHFNITERALRQQVADLREQGYPIITNLSTGGYYLPSTKEEVEEHEAQVRARALKMLGSLKVMKEWKKDNLYERNLLND